MISSQIFKAKGINIIQHYRAGNDATELCYLPTKGISLITVVCPITTGHGTATTLTLSTADDAAATGTTALTDNVAVWVNNVRATDAKAGTIPNTYFALGGIYLKNVIMFEVPAILIPTGKYLGIKCNAGAAGNLYSAIALEDTYYK